MEPFIHLDHVSRDYGQVRGLNDVTLSIGEGVTGLLGPNGAGKSTLIRLVTGQIAPDIGSVKLLGETVFRNPRVLARVGCCPDLERYNDDWSGFRVVLAAAYLSGFSFAAAKERARGLLEFVGLADAMHRPVGSYSKGMRQRAKFAQALVNDPEVLILDEPFTGLDPLGRKDLGELIRAFGAAGRCVLVSSHILHEVETLTDQVVLIHHGKVVAEGKVHEIRSLMSRHPLKLTLTGHSPRALAGRLIETEDVVAVKVEADGVTLDTANAEATFRRIESLVLDGGMDVQSLHARDESLEAVFDYLVKK